MAYSFGSQGATPNTSYGGLFNSPSTNYGGLLGSTPQSKALNTVAGQGPLPSSPVLASFTQSLTPPTTQDVKAHTVNNADGTSTSQTYYPSTSQGSTPGIISGGSNTTQPITGNTQTPSGATVNADTGALVSNPTNTGTTLPGLIGQLAGQGQPSATTQQAQGQSQQAFTGTQNYIDQLNQSRLNEAQTLRNLADSPMPLGNATGYQQAISNYYAQQQAGLGAAGQAESNLYSPALNAAVTGQGQQITALNQAAGLSTPSNQFITQPFNTQLVGADGQPIGGSSGNSAIQSAVVNAINLIKNGSGYSNAVAAANLGQFGPQGTTALLNALGPKFNVNMADADAAAVAQNINTTGTAATSAANTAYNTAVQGVSKATQSYNSLTGVSDQLNQTLANWGSTGVLTNYNQALNKIASLTSNPDYQKFVTALANTQAAYSSVLGSSGVIPTQATNDALSVLNPSSSASAINAALNQLSKDAHALIVEPAYKQQQQYAQQLGIQ